VPERHENGTVTFTTLTPDNIIVALLDYLIDKWGYKQEHTGQKIAVIRDVLGTFAVNDKTGLMGAEAFQTDAGYVFLKELRQRLLAEGYTIPIYGERSGHCWLDITGEIENPVAVAVLFAVMAKQEQYGQDNNDKERKTRSAAYRDKIIPYAQAPRFLRHSTRHFLRCFLTGRMRYKRQSGHSRQSPSLLLRG